MNGSILVLNRMKPSSGHTRMRSSIFFIFKILDCRACHFLKVVSLKFSVKLLTQIDFTTMKMVKNLTTVN